MARAFGLGLITRLTGATEAPLPSHLPRLTTVRASELHLESLAIQGAELVSFKSLSFAEEAHVVRFAWSFQSGLGEATMPERFG